MLLVVLAGVLLVPATTGISAIEPLSGFQGGGGAGQGRGGGGGGGRPPAIADRTAGMQKLDGFMPLYWDEPSGTLFMEVGRWNQELIHLAGLSSGLGSNDIGLDRAQLGGTRIVKFERVGPKVFMTEPNYDYRADSPDAAERKARPTGACSSISPTSSCATRTASPGGSGPAIDSIGRAARSTSPARRASRRTPRSM
jgi:hypothetical protein